MVANTRRVQLMMPRQIGKGALAEEIAELMIQDQGDLALLGRRAAAISTWLDEQIKLDDEALTLCRVSKCANEAGEALDALEKAMGINPRKGVCGQWEDVRKELLDVALTALGAYEHLSQNSGGSALALLDHARTRMERVGLSLDD